MSNLQRSLIRAQQVHLVNQVMENDRIAREFGLSLTESQTLHLLTLRPDIRTASAIVIATGMPRSTIADIVDRLVRTGFLTRERDTSDRRVVHLITTDRVAELGKRYMITPMASRAKEIMSRLSEAELDTLVTYFEDLNDLHGATHQVQPTAHGGGSE